MSNTRDTEETTNLDFMDPHELRAYAVAADSQRELCEYAAIRELEMRARLAGQTEKARCYAKTCDSIYSSLPRELRW